MELEKPIICPGCKVEHPAATELEGADARPSEGSINICGDCGILAVYDKDLNLREPTISELVELQAEKRLWRQITLAQEIITERIQMSGWKGKGSK